MNVNSLPLIVTILLIYTVGATIGRPHKLSCPIIPIFERKNIFPLSGRAMHAPTTVKEKMLKLTILPFRGNVAERQKGCRHAKVAARLRAPEVGRIKFSYFIKLSDVNKNLLTGGHMGPPLRLKGNF